MLKRCPCCGYLTIDDSYEVVTDICEICFWQYDEVAQEMPDRIIGPNRVSLNIPDGLKLSLHLRWSGTGECCHSRYLYYLYKEKKQPLVLAIDEAQIRSLV